MTRKPARCCRVSASPGGGREGELAETLAARGRKYGDFRDLARIAQNFKNTMVCGANWSELQPHQREALEIIASKIARILSGDADHHDSWHDIAGYAQLVADDIARTQGRA